MKKKEKRKKGKKEKRGKNYLPPKQILSFVLTTYQKYDKRGNVFFVKLKKIEMIYQF